MHYVFFASMMLWFIIIQQVFFLVNILLKSPNMHTLVFSSFSHSRYRSCFPHIIFYSKRSNISMRCLHFSIPWWIRSQKQCRHSRYYILNLSLEKGYSQIIFYKPGYKHAKKTNVLLFSCWSKLDGHYIIRTFSLGKITLLQYGSTDTQEAHK